MTRDPQVVWHDLECGAYREDLPLWRALAGERPGRILDLGAGSGRVSLDLAAAGHAVVALDREPALLAALRERAAATGLRVETVLADVREFELSEPVELALVPMQTVQLLGGPAERRAMLTRVRAALVPGGRLALAITDTLEPFEVADDGLGPLADIGEFDGVVYASRPVALRLEGNHVVLERRRETVARDGTLAAEPDRVELSRLAPQTLEAEAVACGFTVAPRRTVALSPAYAGSVVVVLDA